MRRAAGVALALVLVAALARVVLGGGSSSGADRPHAATATATRAAADGGARVVAQRRVAANIVDLTVRSPALGETATVRLVTPTGWAQRSTGRRWPVLYLLHGCCDTPESWTANTDVARIPALRHVLVVTPSGGRFGWYSDWWNGGKGGVPAWETFHLTELRRLLERDYGAGRRRAIAGLSMGGAGALAYAARHPGMFRAAASFSGVVHPLGDPQGFLGVLSAIGVADPEALWGDPGAQHAIWAAHDPVALAPRLRGTPLFVSVGDGTAGPFDHGRVQDGGIEALLHPQNVALAQRLRRLHIPATIDFYGPGTHSWPYWQRELHRALPLLLRALGGPTRAAAA